MKRLIFLLVAAFSFTLSACAGCNGGDDSIIDAGVDAFCAAKNAPVIVRTELDPKEGKAPLTVRFNIIGEDDDFDFCEDETLRYHFDFDGDGFEDGKPRKSGKNVDFTYDKPGDYRVTIWITDAAEQTSKKTNKFIKVGTNEPPQISAFSILPSQGQRPLTPQISWIASDPDGTVDRVEFDYGDGRPVWKQVRNAESGTALADSTAPTYTALGTHTVKLRIYDDTGAVAEKTGTVVVFAQALPTKFVQTIGTSRAIDIADNAGAHFGDSRGRFDYGLVADGHIALKVLRYPLSAFSVSVPTAETTELIGMADPAGELGYARDVAAYQNIAAVVSDKGLYLINFYSPGTPCADASSTNCYPGTPTAPVAYCDPAYHTPSLFGADFTKVQLINPSASGQVWAVANSQPGPIDEGGVYAVRIDAAALPGGVSNSSGCWDNSGIYSFSGYKHGLARRSYDMKVDGDYAYIGVAAEGVNIADLGYALKNRGTCYDAGCYQSTQVTKWRLSEQPGWQSMQHTAYGVELTEGRPVSGAIDPAEFYGRNDLDPNYASPKYPDCAEPAQSVSASGGVTASTTHALLRTARKIYPGNRVALASASGVLTNNGAGYLVTSNVGEGTVIQGDFAAADPATWTTVALHGAVLYAKLPSYPGANPVAFSGSQADQVGRNAVCLNFVNAYAAITSPVNVTFDTAPLLIAAVDGVAYTGIVAFDRSNPAAPVQVTRFGQMPNLTGIETNLAVHEDRLFVSWGAGSPIKVLDLSDPYHLGEAYQRLESFGSYSVPYAANDLLYRVTENNPQGVLLVAAGELGVGAHYVADYLDQGQGVLSTACGSSSTCRDWVDGLQLRHEGMINDIQLVRNDYALVAQQRGGVLVYDVSGVKDGGDPKFVSHIRTKNDPLTLRIVDDGFGNDLVYIADNTSLYRIPFSDPTKPGSYVGSLVTGQKTARSGYTCVDGAVGKIFGCASIYRDYVSGVEYDYPNASTPSIVATGKLFFNNSMSLPAYEIINKAYDAQAKTCSINLPESGTTRIWTDLLAGRLFLFGESSYGVMMREITLDGGGNVALTDVGGGRKVANACQWWQQNFADDYAWYQNRPGVWKRLYGASMYGMVHVYDIGALEDKLVANPAYNLNQVWPKLGSIDVALVGGTQTSINRLVAVGPYVFVGAGESGAWVIDATDGYTPKIVGSSRIAAPGTNVSALNVIAYPDGTGSYTYLTLVSDNRQGGGIRLLRFPGLAAP